ncbi:hypothetical protein JRO89_XS06G0248200 [Xanthoceras sorbifolium]|uniref:Uncharacterized protein n=1 Tax=Xanthoceras sorbifolium TaxID=99658 RepID=A0ABQ8HZ92_9ROSI|nr:hypothetical protein JRO89_XS06G0248200 [Xanthoceras sorbifolium]
MEDKDKDLFLLELPVSVSKPALVQSETTYVQPVQSSQQNLVVPASIPEEEDPPSTPTTQKITHPFQVYSRKKGPVSQPVHAQSSDPNPMTDEVRTSLNSRDPDTQKEDDLDIPIALRKGTRTCTQHPLNLFLSYKNLSHNHRAFLTSLNRYQQETKLKACRSMDISKGSSSSELEAFNECHQETKLSCRSSMAKSQGRASEALDDDQQEISESEEESKSLTESNLDGSSQVYREGSFEKTLNEIDLNRYADLYHAALKGDWEIAKRIIDKDPEALTAKISMVSMTVLHVAGYSCNSKFVEKLVEKMTPEQVAVVDVNGNTALHYAAFTGVVNVAKALLRKNPNLTEVQGSQGFIPLLSAVVHGAAKGKEMASFLATQTKNPFLEATSTHLLLELTHADITLDLLRIFPKMAMVDIYGDNMVSILAVRPMDFLSGTRFNFWETWIYQLAPFKPLICTKGDMEDPPENSEDLKDPNSTAWAARGLHILYFAS